LFTEKKQIRSAGYFTDLLNQFSLVNWCFLVGNTVHQDTQSYSELVSHRPRPFC